MVARNPHRHASPPGGGGDDLSTVAINFLLGDVDAQWRAFVETGELAAQPGEDGVKAAEERKAHQRREMGSCTMLSNGEPQRQPLTPTHEEVSGRSSLDSSASTASLHSPRSVTQKAFSYKAMHTLGYRTLDSLFDGALILGSRDCAVRSQKTRCTSAPSAYAAKHPVAELWCSLLA